MIKIITSFIKRIRAVVGILFVLMILFPPMGEAAGKRIALLVDNSGSMYGRCGSSACNDVMGEVKLSLKNVLPLLYAYNREQNKEQQVDVVLFLFGGYHKGKEEFREIILTRDLEKDMELLEKELVPSTSYNDTNFSLALNRAFKVLEKKGNASCTVFLTDATSGRPIDDIDLSLFGRTFFYSLNRNTAELDDLAARYENLGLQAEVNYLEHGWEITSSFVKAFLMLQQPKEGNHYFFHQDLETVQKQPSVKLTKVTKEPATFHLIFHGKSAPLFQNILLNGKKIDGSLYTVYQGPNIVTIKLKKDSPSGKYTAEFIKRQAVNKVSVFGIEEAPFLLLERKHGNPGTNYKKNEELVFDFSFGVMDKGQAVYLTEKQNKAFKKFVHTRFLINENNGTDKLESKDDLDHFTVSHVFKPENGEDSQYTIKTGWSYLDSDPVPESKVGTFVLLKEPAQVLKLEYSSDTVDKKIWQGRPVRVEAKWESPSRPVRFASVSEIKIKDTITGENYLLEQENGGQSFYGELGKKLSPGKHIFELVDDLSGKGPAVSLTGKELEIESRIFQLDIEETTERSGHTKHGIYNKLKNGFLYLTGNKKKELLVEKYQVKKFPYTKEIQIPYYDAHIHELKVSASLTPVFDDEKYTWAMDYKGPRAYTATDARIPKLFGLFRGDPREIDDALTLQLSPDEKQINSGGLHTIEFIKKECDWEISTTTMASPSITYTPTIMLSGEEITLKGNKMNFSFSTQSWDKEIISALRASAFIAFLIVTVLLFLAILVFLIFLRSHSLHRQEQWEVICKMMPEDFCQPGYLPQRAYKYCEENSTEAGLPPGEILRRAIRDNDKKFLSKFSKAFSLNELKLLKKRCKSRNFNSAWEFAVTGGTTITVCGSELNNSSDCVRLRDFECNLPPVIGSFAARQAANGTELKFNPRPEVVFRLKDALFIPPHNGAIELQSGDVLLIGRHKDDLPVALTVSAYEDTLVVQCKKR